jgi:hypothetical protein
MRNVIVCNDKGGVGKSLVTHLLALVLLDRASDFRIVECEKMSRLRGIFGDLVDYRPIEREKISEIYQNPDVLFAYWDRVAADVADERRCLIDMGAGVTFPFCRWAQASGCEQLGAGDDLTIAVVTTAEQESWRSAANNAEVLSELFPNAHIVVVYNERDGGFYGHNLGAYAGVTLKACRVPIWPYLQNGGRFDLLAHTSSQEIARRCDVPVGTAARSLYAFADWLLEATDALAPVLADNRAPRYVNWAAE